MALRRLALALSMLVLCSWRPMFAQGGYTSGTNTNLIDTTKTVCNTLSGNQNCWFAVAGAPALSKISVGGNGTIVGLKTDNTLTKYDPIAKAWSALPALSGATQVVTGDGITIYAVANSHIYTLSGSSWSQFGTLAATQVAVGTDGDLWAIGTTAYGCGNAVYHYASGSFVQQSQGLSQITLSDARNVYGLCISIPSTQNNLFFYDGSSWASYPGWLAQISVSADAVWGFNGSTSYHQAASTPTWDSIAGLPSYIASGSEQTTYGLFSNQLEKFQPYVIQVVHNVSGTYSGGCTEPQPGYSHICDTAQHVAVSNLQISGHTAVQGHDTKLWNANLNAVASDNLTPQESQLCQDNNVCPTYTTGGPSGSGSGVTCSSMGLGAIFSDSPLTTRLQFETAMTKVIPTGALIPGTCTTFNGQTWCKVPVKSMCAIGTNPPDFNPTSVYTSVSPLYTGAFNVWAACVRITFGTTHTPWQCSPGVALRNPDTITNAMCTHNP